jgi:outer membrane immunogenic protein
MKVVYKVSSLLAGSAALAVAAVAGAGVAQADKYERPGKVKYEAPYNWGGFYFGVHAGWQWSDIDASYGLTGNPALQISAINGAGWGVSHDSPVVGGQIGLQHQFGQLVVGVEGSYTTAYRDNYGSDLCPRQTIALFNCVARFDDVMSIGGRLGWAMLTDCCKNFLPYVTGGYATMQWSAEARNRSLAPGAATIIQWGDGRNTGWYIGGGVDWALAQNWTIGIEYRHYDFDTNLELARAVVGGVWGAVPNDNATFDMSADTITLRVNWKLGRPEPRPLK